VDAVEYDPGMRVELGGREALSLRDEALPMLRLRQRFGYPPGDAEGQPQQVAVVEAGGRRAAVLVDALVAHQDIVVKPFDAARGAPPWFSGATVLGDGTPSLIVDLGSLT
jgi:two-component system, chemotaxis family, sensor kinase CheA